MRAPSVAFVGSKTGLYIGEIFRRITNLLLDLFQSGPLMGQRREPPHKSISFDLNFKSGFSRKVFLEQFSGQLRAFIPQADGFRLALGIGDKALFVKAIHDIPIHSLPGSKRAMPFLKGREIQKCQRHLVSFFGVVVHAMNLLNDHDHFVLSSSLTKFRFIL